MKKQFLLISITIMLSINCFGQGEVSLKKELETLKLFLGKTWVAEDTHPNGKLVLHHSLKFEPIYSGKVLKFFKECKELNNQSNGYYYYDPDKQEIAFLELNRNGNIVQGNIKEENGTIVKYGDVIFPDRKLEFKNMLEFTSDTSFTDKWYRFEDGEWKSGHSRVYTME